jgi:hypothetical protein
MLIINEWYGRFGNNIIQIINSIEYCFQENINEITIPYHTLFKFQKIKLNCCINNSNNIIIKSGHFVFYLVKDNIINLNGNKIKSHFNLYIKPILTFDIDNQISDSLGIHFRSGDAFKNNPHPLYIQPPYSYYKSVINENNNIAIKMFTEDLKNPCACKFNNEYNFNWKQSELKEDLKNICNCKKMILSFSTLSLFLILMNSNCQEIYVADYIYSFFKDVQWDMKDIIDKSKTKLIIYNLPNYIQPLQWKNTQEQQNIMLNYTI